MTISLSVSTNKKATRVLVLQRVNRGLAFLFALVFLSALCMVVTEPVFSADNVPENSWVSKTPMQQARGRLGVAVVNGKIYAIGGCTPNLSGNVITADTVYGPVVGTNEEYDPATDTWTFKSSMPTPRSQFGIAVYQNKIYCIGGYLSDGNVTGVNEVYDPATDKWTTKTAMPTARVVPQANVVNGKIYLIGGRLIPYRLYEPAMVTEAYDPATDSWITKTAPPYRIVGGASAVVGNKIYAIGSRTSPNAVCLQIYNPASDSWSYGANPPTYGSSAIAGVTSGGDVPKRIYFFDESATYIYDPANDSWVTGARMPTARGYTGLVVVDNLFYVLGGIVAPFEGYIVITGPSAANEVYTPALSVGTAPTVSVISPENKTYPSETPLNFFVDESPSWMGYSLDGQPTVTIEGNTTLTGLTEGNHRITVYAKDILGELGSSETTYFTVDTTPPQILILSLENRTSDASGICLKFTVNESCSQMSYSLDSQEQVPVTENITLTNLPSGTHSITVYVQDAAGNTNASETIYFTIAEPFPTTLIIASVVIAAVAVGIAILCYFEKHRHQTKK